jgi:hypothetical protein
MENTYYKKYLKYKSKYLYLKEQSGGVLNFNDLKNNVKNNVKDKFINAKNKVVDFYHNKQLDTIISDIYKNIEEYYEIEKINNTILLKNDIKNVNIPLRDIKYVTNKLKENYIKFIDIITKNSSTDITDSIKKGNEIKVENLEIINIDIIDENIQKIFNDKINTTKGYNTIKYNIINANTMALKILNNIK